MRIVAGIVTSLDPQPKTERVCLPLCTMSANFFSQLVSRAMTATPLLSPPSYLTEIAAASFGTASLRLRALTD